MLLSLKNAPTAYSEVRRVLPPAPAAASPPEPGRVPFRPVGGSGKGSGEGLPLLGDPLGAAGRRVGRPGRRPRETHRVTAIVRPLTPGQKQDSQSSWHQGNLGARREAAGVTGEISAEIVFEVLKMSQQSSASLPDLTVRDSFLRVALVYLYFLFIRSCERVSSQPRFRKRNHFPLPQIY